MREDAFFLIHRIPSVSSQGAWTKREPREGANLSLKVSKFGFFSFFYFLPFLLTLLPLIPSKNTKPTVHPSRTCFVFTL